MAGPRGRRPPEGTLLARPVIAPYRCDKYRTVATEEGFQSRLCSVAESAVFRYLVSCISLSFRPIQWCNPCLLSRLTRSSSQASR